MIVGIALEHERHATRHERAEALTGRTPEMDVDGVVRQALGPILPGDLAAGDGPDHAIDVADGQLRAYLLAPLQRGLAQLEQSGDVKRLVQAVILIDLAEAADFGSHIRLVENVA